jgi:hypothetical protein
MSTEIKPETFMNQLDEVLKAEVAQRHSYFQLKYFVIGKEPTHQARMWQCLRELKSRREALTALDFEIEEAKDNLELSNMQVTEWESKKPGRSVTATDQENNFDQRRYEINMRKLGRQVAAGTANLAQLEERKVWLLQEATFFLESYKNLEKVAPLKHFDDIDAQKEYWGEKLGQKINLKMLLQNPLDMELIETVIALPDDIPVKKQMVGRLNSVQNQLLQLKEEYRKKLGAA